MHDSLSKLERTDTFHRELELWKSNEDQFWITIGCTEPTGVREYEPLGFNFTAEELREFAYELLAQAGEEELPDHNEPELPDAPPTIRVVDGKTLIYIGVGRPKMGQFYTIDPYDRWSRPIEAFGEEEDYEGVEAHLYERV